MNNDARQFAEIFDVSRETLDRLETYANLLIKWNPAINLVSKSTLPELWIRHFTDSAQALEVAGVTSGRWVDLGSGGGFPGLVVAILATEKYPDLKVTCVESDQRKATFLRTVVRETGTDARIIADRIETLSPLNAQIISARALAPLDRLLSYVEPHLASAGTALFLKGTGQAKEIEQALATWTFQMNTTQSRTDPQSTILKLWSIRRV